MTPADLFLARLFQQKLFQQTNQIHDILSTTVGMQAQQQRQAEIGIALRATELTIDDLQQTYTAGTVVRGWAQRWTYQLANQTDFALVIAARRNEHLPAIYFRGQQPLITSLADDLQRTLAIETTLEKDAVEQLLTEAAGPLTSQSKYAVLQLVMARGVATFDASAPANHYRLKTATPADLSANEAMTRLIIRFVIGFGPVSLADFTKWAGVHIGQARPIWNRLLPQWQKIDVQGQAFYTATDITATQLADWRDQNHDHLLFTSGFDALMTGYADKRWLIGPDLEKHLWTKNGILNPIMILNGQVIGTWKTKTQGAKMNFELHPWSPLSASIQRQVTDKLTTVAQFFHKQLGTIIT